MFDRKERLSSLLLRELNQILKREISDALLDKYLFSINYITISNDMSKADVFLTLLDDKDSLVPVQILNKKSYLIQRIMGKNLRLKKIPKLYFHEDAFQKQAQHIQNIIDKVSDI